MYLIPPSSLLKGDMHSLGELTAFASRPRLPREGRAEGSLVVLVVGVGFFLLYFTPLALFFWCHASFVLAADYDVGGTPFKTDAGSNLDAGVDEDASE